MKETQGSWEKQKWFQLRYDLFNEGTIWETHEPCSAAPRNSSHCAFTELRMFSSSKTLWESFILYIPLWRLSVQVRVKSPEPWAWKPIHPHVLSSLQGDFAMLNLDRLPHLCLTKDHFRLKIGLANKLNIEIMYYLLVIKKVTLWILWWS